MSLLICYVVLVFLGGGLSAGVGYVAEMEWGDVTGLSVFLASYFASLWICWVIAVRITAPKGQVSDTSAA
jgi:hypothetical protein